MLLSRPGFFKLKVHKLDGACSTSEVCEEISRRLGDGQIMVKELLASSVRIVICINHNTLASILRDRKGKNNNAFGSYKFTRYPIMRLMKA